MNITTKTYTGQTRVELTNRHVVSIIIIIIRIATDAIGLHSTSSGVSVRDSVTSPLYSRCILELGPGRLVSSRLVTRTNTSTHISSGVAFAARF